MGPCDHQGCPSFSIPSVAAHQQCPKPASQELCPTPPHMPMCTCNHAHTCAYMYNEYKHIHMQPHTIIQACADTAMHECTYKCSQLCNTCTWTHAHVWVHIRMQACMRMHSQICTHVNMLTCTYIGNSRRSAISCLPLKRGFWFVSDALCPFLPHLSLSQSLFKSLKQGEMRHLAQDVL